MHRRQRHLPHEEGARDHEASEDEEGDGPLGDRVVAKVILGVRDIEARVARAERLVRDHLWAAKVALGPVRANKGCGPKDDAQQPADAGGHLEEAVVLAALRQPVVLWDQRAVEALARREEDPLEHLQDAKADERVGEVDQASENVEEGAGEDGTGQELADRHVRRGDTPQRAEEEAREDL